MAPQEEALYAVMMESDREVVYRGDATNGVANVGKIGRKRVFTFGPPTVGGVFRDLTFLRRDAGVDGVDRGARNEHVAGLHQELRVREALALAFVALEALVLAAPGEDSGDVEAVLFDEDLCRAVGLNAPAVRALWQSFLERPGRVYWSRVWGLFVLLRWCRDHDVELAA